MKTKLLVYRSIQVLPSYLMVPSLGSDEKIEIAGEREPAIAAENAAPWPRHRKG